MTIDDKKDIQDALNILSEMIDKEIIDDTPIPTNFIHRPSYNKAIDDFAEKLCDLTTEKSTNVYFDGMFCDILTLDNITDLIFMIAEQLKAGVDNGT